MPTYFQICEEIGRAGPYMTDVIGKCLREVKAFSGSGTSRADKYLLMSETYAAAKRLRDLKSEFDASRAVKGYLIWQESRKYGTTATFPVEVDEIAGIVRQLNQNVYGVLADVQGCLHRKDLNGRFVKWDSAKPHQSWLEPTAGEIDRHDDKKSTFGTNGRAGRVQHGEWRRRVAELWGRKCAITGCDEESLLDGAHIIPHRDATTVERLDEQNGIYLVTLLHRAFDRGLISFSGDGRLLLSPRLSKESQRVMGITDAAKLPFMPERTREYLKTHRHRHRFAD